MLSAKRKQLILTFLNTNKSVAVTELSHLTGVSLTTVRRDLAQMEAEGLVTRIHGGAVLGENGSELPVIQRASQYSEEKRRIGEAAAKLVKDGETIILGGGTTTEAIIPFLQPKIGLIVITNSISIAYQLSRFPHIGVIVLGGWLRHSELSLLGHLTKQALEDLKADKILYGTYAIHPEYGISSPYLPEVETDRYLIEASKELILMVDHSKFGKIASVRQAPIDRISTVITDSKAPPQDVQALTSLGINVIRV